MKTLDYHTIDKRDWGSGPWLREPDKLQWRDEATGMACLIVRTKHAGSLCGYVGVTADHPAYGKHYDDKILRGIDVHGGLTFSGPCQPHAEDTGICHVPEEGEPDNVWWHGFDCAHLNDLSPAQEAMLNRSMPDRHARWGSLGLGDVYRDIDYVQGEVRQLAEQLHAMPRQSKWRGRLAKAKYMVWQVWCKPIRRKVQFWKLQRFIARQQAKR